MTRGDVERLLQEEVVGRIGCSSEGQTYMVPISYAYEDGVVYGHSADGLKIDVMRKNPYVCFEVDRVHNLSNWRSVVAMGRFEELRDADADHAMAILMARLLPLTAANGAHIAPKTMTRAYRAEEGDLKAVVFRIVLMDKTGRFERG